MRILLALSDYSHLTGSEMYYYELGRVLKKRGHDVTIMAFRVGGKIMDKTNKNGIKTYQFFDHPDLKFDLMHLSQPKATAYCLATFYKTPAVVTIHSQFLYEKPFKDKMIKKYIVIRDNLKEQYKELNPILIYNGIDFTRFNTDQTIQGNNILFIGSNDHLRAQVINDLMNKSQLDKRELTLMGNDYDKLENKHGNLQIYDPIWNTETFTKLCGETAGIFLGRTTIEGWACGKNAWIYDVNEIGQITGLTYEKPPKDMKHFDIEYMTDRIEEIYKTL